MESILPGSRVIRVARILVGLGWWVTIAGIGVAVVLTLLWPQLNEGPYWGVRVHVSIPDEAVQGSLSLTSPDTLVARAPSLQDVEGSLRVELHGAGSVLLEWILALPFFAALVFGLHLARTFLREVAAGEVFSPENARRLSLLGWLLVSAGLILPVLDFLRTSLLLGRADEQGVPLALRIWSMGTDLPGILVLVVAGAWRYGVELQRDRDLVV